jgi:hypothetical protein
MPIWRRSGQIDTVGGATREWVICVGCWLAKQEAESNSIIACVDASDANVGDEPKGPADPFGTYCGPPSA